MIILGFALVAFGVLLETQALWIFGGTLIAAGAALALVGTIGRPSQPRSLARWTHPTLG